MLKYKLVKFKEHICIHLRVTDMFALLIGWPSYITQKSFGWDFKPRSHLHDLVVTKNSTPLHITQTSMGLGQNYLRWGNISNNVQFPWKISTCLPKRLKRSHCFTKTGQARVDENRIEKKTEKTTRQTRPIAIQCASVKPKKDGTALLHSTNTPPTITRKYTFMVIFRINIKRLTRMLCYSSYKNANSNKN